MLMKIPEDVIKQKGISYIQKYPYGELAKITKNHKRHYETPDGRQVPSVTTVLSSTMAEEGWGGQGTTDNNGVSKHRHSHAP